VDLIIGAGEIGTSLQKVLGCEIRDKAPKVFQDVNVLHIAFPFDKNFKNETLSYVSNYNPNLTIIHSTVQVGTTEEIRRIVERPVVHSPVMGKHPDLAKHIKKFKKFIGAESQAEAYAAIEYFKSAKINSVWLGNCRTTELAKLLSTTQYGLMIAFHQEMSRMCREAKVPFQAITEWNKAYNAGYNDWNMRNYQRPILKPGFIGGHCVMPNVKILREIFPSGFLKIIETSNEMWEQEMEVEEECELQS